MKTRNLMTVMFVAAATSVVAAEPTPSAPTPAQKPAQTAKAGCEAKGAPIFQIQRKDTTAAKWGQTIKLFESGAWSFDEVDAAGKAGKASTGCLAADDLKTIKPELAAAKWTINHPKIHCMAMSPKFTIYSANGKQVFESHVCGKDTLDADSSKAVQDAEKALAVAKP